MKVIHTNSCDVDPTEGFMFRFLSKYIGCYWVKLGGMQTGGCTM
jgi:hypothetical protein